MITPDNYVVKKSNILDRNRFPTCPNIIKSPTQESDGYKTRPYGDIQKQISTQTKKIVLDIERGGTKEEMVEATVASVQKLSDEHILELAEYAVKIEEHYGKPMDIERAVEDGELFILQARPITTLGEDTRQIFEKAYTRDTTLIIQQAWYNGFLTGILDIETKEPPYQVPVVYYMHD
jgi:phosphoenolpyruvate synthase/pyruvate phosphate dikinase